MNILLISQCRKNALKETRRILDQFAERCGERTWQTPITRAGLQTLQRMLRQSARKNTAVACYWTHGKNLTELLWIVGDRRQFNAQGRVPTARTRRDILRSGDESPWQYAMSIQIVAVIAALLHDLGKASIAFQNKLKKGEKKADAYRHEWVSLRLFQAMVAGCDTDEAWLARLQDWPAYVKAHPDWYKNNNMICGKKTADCDFSGLPPLAKWVGWLIVSHHRMPFYANIDYRNSSQRRRLQENNNTYLKKNADEFFERLEPADYWICHPQADEDADIWQLADDPTLSVLWQKAMTRWAGKALRHQPLLELCAAGTVGNPLLLHLSRLCLMAGDHNYSSLAADSDKRLKGCLDLAANTENGALKQSLDEHLLGVAHYAARFARLLPALPDELPGLLNHAAFRKAATDKRFLWQNKAFHLGKSLRESAQSQGFFGVNLASTGCGKTLGNARIMYALADPERGARFTVALGLRVLTLQTGEALRERLHLQESASLVTLVGNSAVRALYALQQERADKPAQDTLDFYESAEDGGGSESAQALLGEGEYFDCGEVSASVVDETLLGTIVHDRKARELLYTPIVSCTIDHLMPVSEQQRGGRYIAPMLRLWSGDLILDEPDDFSPEDLPALQRLVYWAGLLGSRILLSSATLTPDMVIGLQRAYQDGRRLHNAQRGLADKPVVCAWFDEFQQSGAVCDGDEFAREHQRFCEKRAAKLNQQKPRRRAEWLDVSKIDGRKPQMLVPLLLQGAWRLHQNHGQICPHSGKRVSVGLIRFANINPLMRCALSLLQQTPPPDCAVHVVCYHAKQLLFLRSALEAKLDRILNRKDPQALFVQPEIREALARSDAREHIFIVLGTPVTEVGRDHDYDWAIVEPSSMRSLIQLAGRVWRHRPDKIAEQANILILSHNIKALRENFPAYCRPGFESEDMPLYDEDARELISEAQCAHLNAVPRLLVAESSDMDEYAGSFADLEHRVMRTLLNTRDNAAERYRAAGNAAPFSAHHSLISPFRAGVAEDDYIAFWDEGREEIIFKSREKAWEHQYDALGTARLEGFRCVALPGSSHVFPWLDRPFAEALAELAEHSGYGDEPNRAALHYAGVSLRRLRNGGSWLFHPWGGFWEG